MVRLCIHAGLIVTIVGSLTLSWFLSGDRSRPNRRLPTDMADSVAYDSFSPSPVFPDGKTLQAPPGHSIARGYLPLHYAATTDDAVRAGRELANPFAVDPQPHLERGAALYQAFCAVCHGSGGAGDGPVTRRGVPPPPSLLADNARDMPDGRMFHVLTYGQNNMASYASQLARADRWRVILHVRTLQEASPASQAAAAPPASAATPLEEQP